MAELYRIYHSVTCVRGYLIYISFAYQVEVKWYKLNFCSIVSTFLSFFNHFFWKWCYQNLEQEEFYMYIWNIWITRPLNYANFMKKWNGRFLSREIDHFLSREIFTWYLGSKYLYPTKFSSQEAVKKKRSLIYKGAWPFLSIVNSFYKPMRHVISLFWLNSPDLHVHKFDKTLKISSLLQQKVLVPRYFSSGVNPPSEKYLGPK